MGEGRTIPLARAVQEARRARLSRPQQADRVRRPGARLQLRADDGGGTRRHQVRWGFLAPAISGDAVACIGVSEPGAGSDVASIKTQARSDGDDYVINGGKMWITNGVQADWICLLANTSDGPRHRNKSLICVPMKTRGVQVARKLDKMGMRSSDTAQIFFDNVRVPKRNRTLSK